MREIILLFGVSEGVLRSRLRRALAPQKVMVKAVEPEDYLQPVGFLAGDKTLAQTEERYQGRELERPMLLMAGLGGGRMDQVLFALHKAGISIGYKAALTPTNRTWTVLRLYEEIKEEHRRMGGT